MDTRTRLWASCMVAVVCAVGLLGCEEELVVADVGTAATAGGVQFEVDDATARYLELSAGDEIFEYPRPVLTVPITITNEGKNPLSYAPTHSAQQMNEGSTPLLYPAPTGEEATLPPEQKSPIPGVLITRGTLPGQVTQATSIAPGESLKDIYVFEIPPEDASQLILSLPPVWHRGKTPVLFRMPYTPEEPKGPMIYKVGDAIDFDGVTFTVTGADTAYIKTKDTAQGEGYSKNPLYQVRYTVKNGREEAITYEPNHRAVGGAPGARLTSKVDGALKRVQFGSTTMPVDQVEGRKEVEAGKELKDYALFETPSKDAEKLTFEYPAALFDAKGIARVKIDYTHKTPELPEELKEKKKEDEEKKDEE